MTDCKEVRCLRWGLPVTGAAEGALVQPIARERSPRRPPSHCLQLALQYLESIKGAGVYRANTGVDDGAPWTKLTGPKS